MGDFEGGVEYFDDGVGKSVEHFDDVLFVAEKFDVEKGVLRNASDGQSTTKRKILRNG